MINHQAVHGRLGVRTLADFILIAALLLLVTIAFSLSRDLDRSRTREHEMFVLANRLDAAAESFMHLADDRERQALSCWGSIRQYRLFFDQTSSPMVQPLRPLEMIEVPR